MSDVAAPSTVAVTIDGKVCQAAPGELVIDVAERNGTYIPRFCYHPRMEPVGMCRMCVVEIDTGRGPALQPACMIPVAPDMVVDTESEVTKKAQDGVLEFLLINHPLDCPVCDKGGECPLQDQTMSYGPGESRFIEEKRHFEKPIPISDLVDLDRERCILCDRCTRFANDVAGDTLIHFQDRGNQTQVNTFPDHPFASYFSGNTVQICPVGALTSSAYRFKARPWDLDQAESTCTSCSVGCRMVVQSSRNELLRYQGVDIDPVNWGWLCDKGRFSFQAVNSTDRLGAPLVRTAGGDLLPAGWGEALSKAAAALKAAAPDKVAVLGGSRLTNENAYAWAKLAKGVIGTDNVDAQLGDGLPAEVVLGLPRATIDNAFAKGGTVLVLGPDLKEELPVLFLRLRHAVISDGVKVVELAPQQTSVSELAHTSLLHRPGTAGEVVQAILDGRTDDEVGGVAPEALAAAAAVLADGPVTVLLGRPSMGEAPDSIVAAAAAIHAAHPDVQFLSTLRRGNVHGALDMGLAPGLLPGRVSLADGGSWFKDGGWSTVPPARGLDARGILEAAAAGKLDVLVLLGADPLADFPDEVLAQKALAGARTVISLDRFLTASSAQADVVLAVAGYGEVDGTTTNLEGRVSTVVRKITPPGTARADWMVAAELAHRLGADLGVESVHDLQDEIEALAPSHQGLTRAVIEGPCAHDGVVVPLSGPLSVEPLVDGPMPDAGRGDGDGALGDVHASGAAEHMETGADAPIHAIVADGEAAAAATDASAAKGDADEQATEIEAQEAAADATVADAQPAAFPGGRPGQFRFAAPDTRATPPVDSYSLRLVATRKLYDQGTEVQHAPSLANLAPGGSVRLHPHDFDRLGVEPGAMVTVSAAKGSVILPASPDAGVPRGAAAVTLHQVGRSVTSLMDAAEVVNDVRVERA
ncbi:MAG: NADH-quinone oxidoreductase subunit NuoG [Actinomycetota bacterium]|nr:NADH-quinone oxidoreductase subunit NuoG [Actinomycetota bacterium]